MFRRSFLVRPSAPRSHFLVDLFQTVDRLRNGFPVGERAAQPAVVHVVLRALLSGVCDRRSGLTLGANKQNAAALGDGFTDHVQGRVQHRNGLGEVHDVDAIARAVDERRSCAGSNVGFGDQSVRLLPAAGAW